MIDSSKVPTYLSLCDRSMRLACSLLENAPISSLRYGERQRLIRSLVRFLGKLQGVLSLVEETE